VGQNVNTGGVNAHAQVLEKGLDMESQEVTGVKCSAAVYDEHRILKDRSYIQSKKVMSKRLVADDNQDSSTSAKSQNKVLHFYSDYMSEKAYLDILDRQGPLCYDPAFKAALIGMHRATKKCLGGQDIRAESPPPTPPAPSPPPRKRRRAIVIDSSDDD
jgi:hypothetical protein